MGKTCAENSRAGEEIGSVRVIGMGGLILSMMKLLGLLGEDLWIDVREVWADVTLSCLLLSRGRREAEDPEER